MSSTIVSWPEAIIRSTTWEPMKPEPPVIAIRPPRWSALVMARSQISTPEATPSGSRSGNVHAGDGAGDDEALDLRGALEEGVDLRVPVPLLHREVADVALAAEDLDGLLGGPDGDLARLELAHRALAVLERLLGGAHPRRPPDEEACRVDLHLHVGELERDALVLDDLAPEGLAVLGVVEGEFVGGARDAERLGADDGPGRLERAHRRLHA